MRHLNHPALTNSAPYERCTRLRHLRETVRRVALREKALRRRELSDTAPVGPRPAPRGP